MTGAFGRLNAIFALALGALVATHVSMSTVFGGRRHSTKNLMHLRTCRASCSRRRTTAEAKGTRKTRQKVARLRNKAAQRELRLEELGCEHHELRADENKLHKALAKALVATRERVHRNKHKCGLLAELVESQVRWNEQLRLGQRTGMMWRSEVIQFVLLILNCHGRSAVENLRLLAKLPSASTQAVPGQDGH